MLGVRIWAIMFSPLTLFALLSAIQEDLRSLLLFHLSPEGSAKHSLGDHLYTKCAARMGQDLPSVDDPSAAEQLLNFADYQGGCIQLISNKREELPPDVWGTFKPLISTLTKLTPIRNRVAHSLLLNFDDLSIGLDVATELVRGASPTWSKLRATLNRVKNDPSFVLGLDLTGTYLSQGGLFQRLPLPDFDETGFIGRKKIIQELGTLCRGPYPVITIVGSGGLGKTALALRVAYNLLDQAAEEPFRRYCLDHLEDNAINRE